MVFRLLLTTINLNFNAFIETRQGLFCITTDTVAIRAVIVMVMGMVMGTVMVMVMGMVMVMVMGMVHVNRPSLKRRWVL